MCTKIIQSSSTNPNNTPNMRISTSQGKGETVNVDQKDCENKKREDLTSLGSDDSGMNEFDYDIILESYVSLNKPSWVF